MEASQTLVRASSDTNEECEHKWITDFKRGEDVCVHCGFVGESVMVPMVSQSNITEDVQTNALFRFLRDEVVECIMRISGGDCCDQHVETIMRKLKSWHEEGDPTVRQQILRCGLPHQLLGRGILAVAIHSGLLENGRYEIMELIASTVGATMPNVQLAEKILRVSRTYMKSSSLLQRIVEKFDDLDTVWRKAILSVSENVAKISFREPDVMVAAAALALGKAIRKELGKNTACMDVETRLQRLVIRKQLRHLTGAALCRRLNLTYGTMKRAMKDLDETTLLELQRQLEILMGI